MNKEKQIEKAVILTYLNNENIMGELVRRVMEDICIDGAEGVKMIYKNSIINQVLKTYPFCSNLVDDKIAEKIKMETGNIILEMKNKEEISSQTVYEPHHPKKWDYTVKIFWTGNLI